MLLLELEFYNCSYNSLFIHVSEKFYLGREQVKGIFGYLGFGGLDFMLGGFLVCIHLIQLGSSVALEGLGLWKVWGTLESKKRAILKGNQEPDLSVERKRTPSSQHKKKTNDILLNIDITQTQKNKKLQQTLCKATIVN